MTFVRSVVAVNLIMVSIGIHFGWAAQALPKLVSIDSTDPFAVWVNYDDTAWIASFTRIGDIVGIITASIIGDQAGRRTMLLYACISMGLGWLQLVLATTFEGILFGRIITGMGAGVAFFIGQMYLSEIAPENRRGTTLSTRLMSISFGMFLCLVIAWLLSVRMMARLTIAFQLLCGILAYYIEESPYYKIVCGDCHGARESLAKLRGENDLEEYELKEIAKRVEDEMPIDRSNLLNIFFDPQARKALFNVMGLVVAKCFSGNHAVVIYSSMILNTLTRILKAEYLTMLMGLMHLIGVVCAVTVFYRFGRKTVLSICFTISALCMINQVVYFFYVDEGYDLRTMDVLVNSVFMVHTLMDGLGFTTIIYPLVSELFYPKVRVTAMAFVLCFEHFCTSVLLKGFSIVSQEWTLKVSFAIFAMCSGFGVYHVSCFLRNSRPKCKRFEKSETSSKTTNGVHGIDDK